ncbi:MAG: RNA polymerase sigma factor [Patescibacteria group bacterium]|nr:RNA polymerase sigma factor [Patescibacteria group bacterium]
MPPDEYQNKTDEELAQSVLKDANALVVLIRRYESRLLSYIRRISGSSVEDAEDILQESFMDAYKHIANFDPSLKFSSWIYRIVHNRTISAYRKKKKEMGDMSIDADDDAFKRMMAAGDDTARMADQNLTAEMVGKILKQLSERDRNVLVLAYMEEKTYDEISDILRAPPGTVATWIRRAKQKFQKSAEQFELANKII